MTENLSIADPSSVPVDFNSIKPDLEYMIDLINGQIEEAKARSSDTSLQWDNEDGTHDKFRCVIYFDDNTKREYFIWKEYHAAIVDAYRKAGWIVKPWFTRYGQHVDRAYCIALLQNSPESILAALQNQISKP